MGGWVGGWVDWGEHRDTETQRRTDDEVEAVLFFEHLGVLSPGLWRLA